MTMSDECEHGDLPEACPPCLDAVARERGKVMAGQKGARYFGDAVRVGRTPRAITARYDADCPECGSQIRADVDPIAKVDGEWVCAECAGAAL